MPELATVEEPRLEVGYEQLSPSIHTALERIVHQRTDCSFRVDGVGVEDLDTMRSVLQAAQGNHLPRHTYDEHGNSVAVSRTPVVEERHTRVFPLDLLSGQDEQKSLLLRVPRYSEEQPTREMPKNRWLSDKQFLLALGGTGLTADAAFMAGLVTGKPGFFVAFVAGASGIAIASTRRIRASK